MNDNNINSLNALRQRQITQNELYNIRQARFKSYLALIAGDTTFPLKRGTNYHTSSNKQGYDSSGLKISTAMLYKNNAAQSLAIWNKTKGADIVFVRQDSRKGTYYLTFGQDAKKTAKALNMQTQKTRIGKHTIDYLSIPAKRMKDVSVKLEQRDLTTKTVNKRGVKVDMIMPKRNITPPAVSVTMTPPKLDVNEKLDKNRNEKRETPIRIEGLSVRADSNGNWKVSGLVNGVSVTANAVSQQDVSAYKKGQMNDEQLVRKYQLDKVPEKEITPARKNSFVRRYSQDG